MKSIVHELVSEEFPRVRVGIGKPIYAEEKINYVIGELTKEEYEILENGIEKATMAVQELVKNGIDIAMNKYN